MVDVVVQVDIKLSSISFANEGLTIVKLSVDEAVSDTVKLSVEEALDLAIYLSSKIVELRNKRWGVKRERSTINHRPKVMVEAIEKETMSRMGQAGCRGGDCD